MIIIGIDPGTTITGYGIICIEGNSYVVKDYGCIRPPPSEKLTERYRLIYEGLCELLDTHHPEALAVETQYVSKNPQSALKLGMARGIVLLAATLRGISVFEYAPSRAKQAVVGNGRASKQQVGGMVQRLLRLREPPYPEDAADALALAICHAQAAQFSHHLQAVL